MISRRGFLAVPLGACGAGPDAAHLRRAAETRPCSRFQEQPNGRFDVALVKNKVARVAQDLPPAHAKLVLDVGDYYVTPGLIDIHTHFDAGGADLNLQPDHHALPNGVTTAVDAGGSGHRNFEAFKSRTIDHSKTRILAWLNIVGAGMYGPESKTTRPDGRRRMRRHGEKVPGHHRGYQDGSFQPPTWDAVDRAVEAGRLSSKPVMVDFHAETERSYPDLLLKHLRPGDIHTHFYGGAPPLSTKTKRLPPMLRRRASAACYSTSAMARAASSFATQFPLSSRAFCPIPSLRIFTSAASCCLAPT